MYTSLTQVKQYVGDFDDANDEALIEDVLIPAAQAFIDLQTEHIWELPDESAENAFPADDPDVLFIDGFDLFEIESIENGDGEEVTDFSVVPRNRPPYYQIVNNETAWTGDVLITGSWCATEEAPADIVWAATRLTAWLYKQLENYDPAQDRPTVSPSGMISTSIGNPR